MRIQLRVEHLQSPAAGGAPTTSDVEVDVTASHTVGELAAALVAACDAPTGDRDLVLVDAGRHLPADLTLVEAGVLAGDRLCLGRAALAALADRPDPAWPGLHLTVVSGLDAGRHLPLTPGDHVVGRDPVAALPLTDPQVSRHDLTVRVGAGDEAGVITVDPGPERTNEVRRNGWPVTAPTPLGIGDHLQLGSTTLRVDSPPVPRPRPAGGDGSGMVGTVAFERTPRFHQPVTARTVEPLGRVPVKPEPRRFQVLAVLAPLILGCTMAWLFHSPRYLLFAGMSPIVGIGNHIDSRRSGTRQHRRRCAEVRERLARRIDELAGLAAAERQQRLRNAPDPVELVHQARAHHPALWNRDRAAGDFLALRVGLATLPSGLTIRPETQGDDDLRAEIEAAQAPWRELADVPVTVALAPPAAGPGGFNPAHAFGPSAGAGAGSGGVAATGPAAATLAAVGPEAETTSLATALLVQAACLHSPEDLVIVAATSSRRGLDRWLRWVPHTRAASSPLAGAHLAGDAAAADRLLREVLRVVEGRVARQEQRLDLRWPWLLLVIDRSLEPDPGTVARLADLGATAGLSILWLTDNDRQIPRQATAVAQLRAPGDGVPSHLVTADGSLSFEPARLGADLAGRAARSLAPLIDTSAANAAAAVPTMVTLFDALSPDGSGPDGTGRIDAEWVARQWHHDRGYALPAPVGRTDTGPLILDLVTHGPHGLIGGTSGAGKSELVQSLVAGLIACNSPERVNVLFVDYKGGALSGLFGGVPHCVGAVTNLDGLLSLRALTSLKAELDRRMALFEHHRVRDIRQMLERHPAEAPASLVIVVDEFASLVRELPDFVDGIVSIAERGRSLGIHLLLSTQRPSGSINENIQQNTNLRLALRMLDGGESTNVIGTPEAAAIPAHLKGRGYARLGPGQLIAFQAAWSGAPVGGGAGHRPILVGPFTGTDPDAELAARGGPAAGGAGAGDPVAGDGVAADRASAATELDAVLAAAAEAAQRLNLGRGRAPWMEVLPGLIPLDRVLDDPRSPAEGCPVVTIGMVDDPEAQDQYPAAFDLADGGGLAVFGCGGSGRTTALVTAACSAAIRDSQGGGGRLSIFGLDFGSRQLGVLNRLPQCEVVADGDDLEAVTRVVSVLGDVFARRQAAVAAAAQRGDTAPAFAPVLLVIDGYDALADVFTNSGNITVMQPWFDRIVRLVTLGRQVGIHTVVASGSMSGMSGRLMAAISNRITLRQTDDNAYRAFGLPGPVATGLHLEPGQALTRTGRLLQVAVAGTRPAAGSAADNTADGGIELDPGAVARLADGLVGSVAPECRTRPLPEEVAVPTTLADPADPAATADPAEEDRTAVHGAGGPLAVSLGLTDLTLEPAVVDVSVAGLCVLGPPRSGRSNALLTVAAGLEATASTGAGVELWAVGPAGSPLEHRPGWAGSAFGRPADVVPMLEQLAQSADLFRGVTRFLLVDDADRFDDMALNTPLKAVLDAGVRLVGSAATSRSLMGSLQLHKELKAARNLLVLKGEDGDAIQSAVGARYSLRPGLALCTGRGVLVRDGLPSVVQTWHQSPATGRNHPANNQTATQPVRSGQP